MRIRLADYVADFLVRHGVTDVFSVVGGGAMHLKPFTGFLSIAFKHIFLHFIIPLIETHIPFLFSKASIFIQVKMLLFTGRIHKI